MAIEIKKTLLGGTTIGYECPHCKARLKSSLDKAGTTDNCPECHREFVVPGTTERDRINTAVEAERKQKELKRQEEARKQEEVKRQENIVKQAKQRAEELQRESIEKQQAASQVVHSSTKPTDAEKQLGLASEIRKQTKILAWLFVVCCLLLIVVPLSAVYCGRRSFPDLLARLEFEARAEKSFSDEVDRTLDNICWDAGVGVLSTTAFMKQVNYARDLDSIYDPWEKLDRFMASLPDRQLNSEIEFKISKKEIKDKFIAKKDEYYHRYKEADDKLTAQKAKTATAGAAVNAAR